MKEVLDALKYLYKNGVINDIQFQEFYSRCNTPNVDLNGIKNELKKIYDDYESSKTSFDFEIIDVDDGELSGHTGIYSISKILENIDSKKITGDTDDLNEYEEIGEGNSNSISKSYQKTLSGPGGSHVHWGDDGFTTLMLIMFLTGISVGIISMIVLNFVA